MEPITLLQTAIWPALADLEMLGIKNFDVHSGQRAARFLLAIALQESNLRYRRQVKPVVPRMARHPRSGNSKGRAVWSAGAPFDGAAHGCHLRSLQRGTRCTIAVGGHALPGYRRRVRRSPAGLHAAGHAAR